ncbi:MAG: 30S ribosomal protein S6e [Crenarchaeota archaeon]|nr:30S ribosomal protein S6e [Thermoproteota archaeon]
MPEFKIVVSDPRAKADSPVKKVKVKGHPEIEWSQEEKEGKKLPVCRVSRKLLEELRAELGIITVRIKTEDKKVNITCRAVIDDSIPDNEVYISLELLGEKAGAEEAEAEAFRAKAWQVTLTDPEATRLLGLKIGDRFEGGLVGLPGFMLEIRGGSDSSGFPMHPAVQGPVKKRVLLSGPPGFHPREKGERRRKMVRGNTISPDIVQVNTKLVYPADFKPVYQQ